MNTGKRTLFRRLQELLVRAALGVAGYYSTWSLCRSIQNYMMELLGLMKLPASLATWKIIEYSSCWYSHRL
jgi:hypothetical protein